MRVFENGDYEPPELPGNSNIEKYRKTKDETKVTPKPGSEKPKLEKIVSGEVKKQKRGFFKRMGDTFVGGDKYSVKEYFISDILIPGIKNVIVNAIYTVSDGFGRGAEMLFFGEGAGRSRRGNINRMGQRSFVSYDQQYDNPAMRSRNMHNMVAPVSRARHDFDDIVIESRGEAEEVVSHLVDLIVDYGTASVADLYSLVGIDTEHPDFKFGWTDLRGAMVVRVPNGYVLDLPRPITLD